MAIRSRLYEKLGAKRARQLLATAFPGGSSRTEIKRRVLAKSSSENESKTAMTGAVIEEIVEELVLRAHQALEEAERQKFRMVS